MCHYACVDRVEGDEVGLVRGRPAAVPSDGATVRSMQACVPPPSAFASGPMWVYLVCSALACSDLAPTGQTDQLHLSGLRAERAL